MPIALNVNPSQSATNVIANYGLAAGVRQGLVAVIKAAPPANKAAAIAALSASDAGAADAFATDLQNYSHGGTIKTAIDALFGRNRPRDAEDFVALLADNEKQLLKNAIWYPAGQQTTVCATDNDLIESLKTFKRLDQLYRWAPGVKSSVYSVPKIDVNPFPGLNLLLANPVVAKVIMQQRQKQSQLALARVTPSNGFLGLPIPFMQSPNSVSVMFRGGSAEMAELDPSFPVEMRGAGYSIAHMRGGNWMVGTASSPTMWRPVSDDSFISTSLRQALATLNQSLDLKNASLDQPTQDKVENLIKELERAEKKVKDYRDQLNTFNNAISTGQASVDNQKNMDVNTVKTTVDAYNNWMKSRQKLENKLFRVVIALGGKVQTFP